MCATSLLPHVCLRADRSAADAAAAHPPCASPSATGGSTAPLRPVDPMRRAAVECGAPKRRRVSLLLEGPVPPPGSRAAPLPVDSPGGASGRCHSRALQGTGTAPDTTAAHSAAPSPGVAAPAPRHPGTPLRAVVPAKDVTPNSTTALVTDGEAVSERRSPLDLSRAHRGWIRWEPRGESIDDFVQRFPPSAVGVRHGVHWLAVDALARAAAMHAGSPRLAVRECAPVLAGLAARIARQERVCAEETAATVQRILSIASRHRYTTGKWLVFVPRARVDPVWLTVARATAEGRLGMSAKCAAQSPDRDEHVICVYCDDFAAREDVQRVVACLQACGLQVRSGFKPDIFTLLGIYANNPWGLDATIYGYMVRGT